MSRNTEFQFVSTDAAEIVNFLISVYENLTGTSVRPASPEKLFAQWVASVIIQERVYNNYTANQNIPSRAEGKNLDALAELYYLQQRPQAKPAYCTERFTISEAQTFAILVPKGTRVTDPSNTLIWETVADAYATVQELNNHKNDKNNPHSVTKEQIGLGNVENKTFADQTPKFTPANELSDIISGEKMGSILGKIAKALSLLKAHLSDYKNPHKTKAADIGAAASKHSHSATDINDGTVIVQRGGTGRGEWTKNCIVFADTEKSFAQVAAPTEISLLAQGPDSAPLFMKLSSLSMFTTGTTPPTQKNLFWIDPTPVTGGLKYWNGTDWEHVPVAYS